MVKKKQEQKWLEVYCIFKIGKLAISVKATIIFTWL